jgi:Tellurite resistance protein TehB
MQYACWNPIYSTAPNAFLAEVIQELQPGRALKWGMGGGRNIVFLAQRGWDVTEDRPVSKNPPIVDNF